MVKTFVTYAVATVQALGPSGLLGVTLLACGLMTLLPHLTISH